MSKKEYSKRAAEYSFTLKDDGQVYTLKRFSEVHPVHYQMARKTWIALGSPESVTLAEMTPAALRSKSPRGRYTQTIEVEFGSGTIAIWDFRRIAEHCAIITDCPVTPVAIYKRWTKMGRPDRVHINAISKTKVQVMAERKEMDIKTPAAEALDDIEAGDLEHLGNGPVNTGAARQGCDEWGNRKTFCGGESFQGRSSLGMPCYQGRQ